MESGELRTDITDILKKYWGYEDFRGIQLDIIESLLQGHDTLGLMPTGGGKSITFQVPALALQGVCIVITPLIALMKDQVHHLRQHGIPAAAIYSGMQHDDILRILENAILGSTKLLYVSPERLASELFQTKLRHMNVSFITVDEAHCISQWGYDFRPSYLTIADIRLIHPHVPVLALTATATPAVVDDICQHLTVPSPTSFDHQVKERSTSFRIFRQSFARPNIAYIVQHSPDKHADLVRLLSGIQGSAIVYVRSRRRTREIAQHLTEAAITATFYHAGLQPADRDQRQRDWQHDRVRVIVATNAFGMGIDKADVRIVVHYDIPDSPEAYFQEAGRAGRDGQPARAVLLYNAADRAKLQKRVADTFPPRDEVRQVYEHLAYYFQMAVGDGYGVAREFNIDDFCQRFRHFPIRVHAALQLLQQAGYIDYDGAADRQARIRFLVTRDDLYRLDTLTPDEDHVVIALLRNYGGLFADYTYVDESLIAREAGLTAPRTYDVLMALSQRHLIHFIPRKQVPYVRYLQRREDSQHVQLPPAIYEQRLQQYQQRIDAMLSYVTDNSRCRSQQLLAYFGETDSQPCGQCDVCLSEQDENSPADAKTLIINLLNDRKRHHITELLHLPVPQPTLHQALTGLIQEEHVVQEDGFLTLK